MKLVDILGQLSVLNLQWSL